MVWPTIGSRTAKERDRTLATVVESSRASRNPSAIADYRVEYRLLRQNTVIRDKFALTPIRLHTCVYSEFF